nr:MAG TPA: hypothetical protein [Caudoviricetes sp.]
MLLPQAPAALLGASVQNSHFSEEVSMISYRKLAMRVLGHPLRVPTPPDPRLTG